MKEENIINCKKIYNKGNRHHGECYYAVTGNNEKDIAYLKVDEEKERLVYREDPEAEEIVITKDTYILSPHFAGKFLFWVEKVNNNWIMKAVKQNDLNTGRISIFESFCLCGFLQAAPGAWIPGIDPHHPRRPTRPYQMRPARNGSSRTRCAARVRPEPPCRH